MNDFPETNKCLCLILSIIIFMLARQNTDQEKAVDKGGPCFTAYAIHGERLGVSKVKSTLSATVYRIYGPMTAFALRPTVHTSC